MEYPLSRDYKLYELDGNNCQLITGMGYEELRETISSLFSDGLANTKKQDQMNPAWTALLNLPAQAVWEFRQRRA